ncbi:MAG: hypothetical protein QOG28_2076 [Trebonia sp.]|jgi:hypothetical protein|nr:putative secreted protein [Actinomycetes bacterium]MDX6417456.1 hypothetical protein [Trebonia sp.]
MKNVLAAGAALAAVTLAACSSGSSGSAATASTTTQARPALTASQIAQRMGIGNITAYTGATDPNHLLGRQHEYTSKINWEGGSIEVFPNAAYAKARETYVQAFTCPFGDGYDYLDGTALLRLACALTPAQAQANEALFKKVLGAA